tara:strand:+ start:333 stop:647 length:315 start_codon:yes stop_codon:yes gene_type:complete
MITYQKLNNEQQDLEADKCVVNFIKGMIVARKMRKLNNKKFASMVGVTESYLSQVVNSIEPKRKTKELSGQLMFKIANTLQSTVDLLIFYGNHYDYYMNSLPSK